MSDPASPRWSWGSRSHLALAAYLLGAAAIVAALLFTRTTPGASPATLDIRTTSSGTAVDPPEITVTGIGLVTGTPDTLTVTFDVDTQAAHASDALSKNETETSQLLGTLTGNGVSQSDIQTVGMSIQPSYGDDGSITGYEVDETLTVTLHDLTTAGAIIDAASRSVGDDVRIDDMSLSIADSSSLMAQARQAAMADAQSQASELASGAGTSLGPIVSVSEQSTPTQTPIPFGLAAPAASSAVPVQPGSQQLSVDVTVVYQLGS
ncbi:MAG: SIMPL domain-containing protein [Candidatus Dormiibacterota bacterium]